MSQRRESSASDLSEGALGSLDLLTSLSPPHLSAPPCPAEAQSVELGPEGEELETPEQAMGGATALAGTLGGKVAEGEGALTSTPAVTLEILLEAIKRMDVKVEKTASDVEVMVKKMDNFSESLLKVKQECMDKIQIESASLINSITTIVKEQNSTAHKIEMIENFNRRLNLRILNCPRISAISPIEIFKKFLVECLNYPQDQIPPLNKVYFLPTSKRNLDIPKGENLVTDKDLQNLTAILEESSMEVKERGTLIVNFIFEQDLNADYAEKENAIAKALQDFKANFYCELCDKQYYKHQEFDNHINSYDHAHKQRLKELKQREFARNVASKSRKDEKKQEKDLRRLHRLAELRKEATCAPGSGPMFKSTTVSVRDKFNEVPQTALTDSGNRQDDCTHALPKSIQNDKSVSCDTPSSPGNARNESNKLGDQIHGQKVIFSFAFPKKTAVKLESSAAVFYEFNDEMSVENGFCKKSRFDPRTYNLQSVLPTEIVLCSEEKDNCAPFPVEKGTDTLEAPPAQKSNELSNTEDNSASHPSTCQLNVFAHSFIETNSLSTEPSACSQHKSPSDVLAIQDNPKESDSSEWLENKVPFQVINMDFVSLHEDHGKSSDSFSANAKPAGKVPDIHTPLNAEGDSTNLQHKQNSYKRMCEAFVPVLSKDGSTVLQWPSEMVSYTTAEPSISFSCNPLCFDFKSSRSIDGLEKQKHLSPAPLSQCGKTDDYLKSSVSDQAETNEMGLANYNTSTSTCITDFSQITSFLTDGTETKSHDSTRTQESLGVEVHATSCGARKLLKHISKKCLEQERCTGDNNILAKEMHVKCVHKTRKRKRRRKLCQHSAEKIAKQTTDISATSEQDHGDQCLRRTSENHSKVSDITCRSDQVQQPYQKVENGHNDGKGTSSRLTLVYDNKSSCEFWDSKQNNEDSDNNEILHTKNKTATYRQSKQLLLNPGPHSLTYSRTVCNWRVRRLNCGLDHNCVSHQINQFSDCSHSLKRAYSSLNEPEESSSKRRHCVHSSSSDESYHKQIYFSEQQFSDMKNFTLPCKPKRKRRRKKTLVYHAFADKESRDIHFKPSNVAPPINIFREFITHGTVEGSIPQQNVDFHGNMDQANHLVQSSISCPNDLISLENSKSIKHSIMKSVPDNFLTDLTYSSQNVKSDLSLATSEKTIEPKEKKNGFLHKSSAAYKMSSTHRNFEPFPPKSYVCRYELMDTVPLEKIDEATTEWLRYNAGILNSQPPLTLKEAHINHQTFLTTEQILAPFHLPDQRLLYIPEHHEKVKGLQCDAYQHMLRQNMVANEVKLTLPAAAVQPSLLQPLPLQQPFCSTSVTRIHHTILQQHAAAATATMSTVKFLHPHQQFLSQVPALSRTPLPHISVGPGLCPGAHTAFVAPPQVPLIPASVMHPSHLSFPPLLQTTLLPPLLSAHPTVIPLQPFF
uniref:Zinc finger protein 804A n=1 Tax=Geotrypetes seraphini TaxID=260995 RepID=A0A6P8RFC3_GEOSA|nr:zinc finger protein 804A [Geotrypetes seraphini]